MWGTDQECKLRQPDDPFYKKFAAECSRVQIAIDVFAMGCAPSLCRPAVHGTQRCGCRDDFPPSGGMQLGCMPCNPSFFAGLLMARGACLLASSSARLQPGPQQTCTILPRLQVDARC